MTCPRRSTRTPSRATAAFSKEERVTTLTAPIPEDRRTCYAILFLACFRLGEPAALRWRHYDVHLARPRGRALPAGGDRLIGAEEAATVLGMTATAVRKAAARGTIPAERLGRRLRFRLSVLLACDRHLGRRTGG
jgi:excisionase family DNA binding protein